MAPAQSVADAPQDVFQIFAPGADHDGEIEELDGILQAVFLDPVRRRVFQPFQPQIVAELVIYPVGRGYVHLPGGKMPVALTKTMVDDGIPDDKRSVGVRMPSAPAPFMVHAVNKQAFVEAAVVLHGPARYQGYGGDCGIILQYAFGAGDAAQVVGSVDSAGRQPVRLAGVAVDRECACESHFDAGIRKDVVSLHQSGDCVWPRLGILVGIYQEVDAAVQQPAGAAVLCGGDTRVAAHGDVMDAGVRESRGQVGAGSIVHYAEQVDLRQNRRYGLVGDVKVRGIQHHDRTYRRFCLGLGHDSISKDCVRAGVKGDAAVFDSARGAVGHQLTQPAGPADFHFLLLVDIVVAEHHVMPVSVYDG